MEETTPKTLLEQVKELLGIEDDSKDVMLNHLIALTTTEILSYTHQPTLPLCLEVVVVDVVYAQYNEMNDPSVKELKLGENTYKYDKQSIRSRVLDFKALLNTQVTLVWD